VPGLINRVPQGLLSLLDLKAQGENAKELSYQLFTVLEALDFYLAPIREIVTDTETVPGTGPDGDPNLSPPAGQIWFVRQFGVFSTADLAVGATLQVVAGILPLSGVFLPMGDLSNLAAVGERVASSVPDQFILQSGQQLGYFTTVFGGAPGVVRITASIARLSV